MVPTDARGARHFGTRIARSVAVGAVAVGAAGPEPLVGGAALVEDGAAPEAVGRSVVGGAAGTARVRGAAGAGSGAVRGSAVSGWSAVCTISSERSPKGTPSPGRVPGASGAERTSRCEERAAVHDGEHGPRQRGDEPRRGAGVVLHQQAAGRDDPPCHREHPRPGPDGPSERNPARPGHERQRADRDRDEARAIP